MGVLDTVTRHLHETTCEALLGEVVKATGVPLLLVPVTMREFLPSLVFPVVLLPGSFRSIAWQTLLG